MNRRKRVRLLLLTVIVLGVGATLVKLALNSLNDWSRFNRAGSIAEAKARGLFVCQLFPDPSTIPWDADSVDIQEAWVEQEAEEKHFLAWWKYYQPTRARQVICLNLSKDVSRLPGFYMYTFGIQKAGHEGFTLMVEEIKQGSNSRYWTSIGARDAPVGLTLVIYGPSSAKQYLTIPLRR
jgi:hypothetical protein